MTSLSELKTLLDSLGIPVAYNHFNTNTSAPFITYYIDNQDNFCADNKVWEENSSVLIELYSTKKDITLESSLITLLNDNEIPYNINFETYIPDEGLYQVVYEITI